MSKKMPKELTYYLKLGDAVVIVGEDQLIIDVNEQYETITGYKREFLIGFSVEDLKSSATPFVMYKSLKNTLRNGKPWSGTMVNVNKSLEIRHSFITITPIDIKGIIYYVGVMRMAEQLLIEEVDQKQIDQKELFKLLALSSEMRDVDIAEHLLNVQKLTEEFLLSLFEERTYNLSVDYISNVVQYSVLHDIGKSSIPESILYKTGSLTIYEKRIMEMHPLIGVDVLDKLSHEMNNKLFQDIEIAQNIIKFHHENWDGTGYPMGLKGEEIPFEARVISIVDVYDALVSNRAYKEAWTKEEALAYLNEQKGIKFDPNLVEVFVEKVIGKNSILLK
ncbi:HD domain-containing phosphohydrolase [Lysinibacillus sp. G4S2]|uniref:HD domain-containing phosphohydrolase n=1 Tax=Lysinibacillus sp. G4S2 TaxID=3055859 RepID=UPI0025A16D22|nr:HD domain-containing phosphohydrolase [Lysinibacillus sp. G4S2]MDM5246642.1 HD domain-containing phosphohydrolase [Lysinibacillus sp. G4S2]